MKKFGRWIVRVGVLLCAGVLSAQVPDPVQVPVERLEEAPYRYVGVVESDTGRGTGFVVQPRVMVTAAHVIFNPDDLRWETGVEVKVPWSGPFFIEYYSSENRYAVAGRVVLEEGYAQRVENDDEPGVSSWDTFNADIAALFFLQNLLPMDGYNDFIESRVDDSGVIGALRQPREKKVLGYPLGWSGIGSSNRGRLFETGPQDFEFFWAGLTDDPESWLDSEGLDQALYFSEEFLTYGGNSGGPMVLLDDQGHWVASAALVGGSDDPEDAVSLFRSIDETAWGFIVQAATASGGVVVDRPAGVVAVSNGSGVRLTWQRQVDATGYRIFRRGVLRWELVATVGDVDQWTDDGVPTGREWSYRVQAVYQGQRFSPVSRVASASVGVHAPELAAALESPYLTWSSGGENSFYLQSATRLRSGAVYSLGASVLETTVIGPGTLQFTWDTSSEANPDIEDPFSPVFGEIWDALYFYVNDEPEQREFISGGPFGPQTVTVELPGGQHVLRWEYRKDPYANEGEDAGFLDTVSWQGRNPGVYVRGAFNFSDTYRLASWWGYYTSAALPWTFHAEHGWLYLSKVSNDAFWAYSSLPEVGWMYVDWRTYPQVYSSTQNAWLFYYRGTGIGGTGHWFYNTKTGGFVRGG